MLKEIYYKEQFKYYSFITSAEKLEKAIENQKVAGKQITTEDLKKRAI